MEKKYKILSIILGLITILLGVYIVITSTNKKEINCKEQPNKLKNEIEDKLNIEKLYEIKKGTYNFIKIENVKIDEKEQLSFKLDVNGTINVNFENNISNITNAKDIKQFNNFSQKNLYILTEDGDIYLYDVLDYEKGNYTAKKLEEYKNIKQITDYVTRRAGAGGCDYIIAIDNNDNYMVVTNECV